ncbi:MAG: endonuclease/exonuclease/phosphatase family protein [Phycisphaerae bacterium]|nr:endonuclease/exonuclease/phosphatase family protein [Phycisphaerae bacterium]
MNRVRFACSVAACFGSASVASAQWDPTHAQWGKTRPSDLRVMTWNVQDGVCTSNPKASTDADWDGLVRSVAAFKPDVLFMQETGDNSGNGTGSGLDSVADLATVISMFFNGGTDSFRGNAAITSWVKKYAASFDMPYVFVSANNDGFNRNVILSRYPFADLNGDNKATNGDIFSVSPDLYAPGGGGGIRGFATTEINLPDSIYAGNLLAATCHLKSGGDSQSMADRITASQNITYFLDYFFNGANAGTPDPRNRIGDSPAATSILGPTTPMIWGGDFNEDELNNGRKGPAEWMTIAPSSAAQDGTDRDRSDSTYDSSVEFFSGSRNTQGSSKLDYICWQDSIATLRRSWVFNSALVPLADQPPEFAGYIFGIVTLSTNASDHRLVVADFRLPLRCPADWNLDGSVDDFDFFDFLNDFAANSADYNNDGSTDDFDFFDFLNDFAAPC